MVEPLQTMEGPNCCLEGAPLFWNCTAWLVTLPVAAAWGFEVLLTFGSSANTGLTEKRQIAM